MTSLTKQYKCKNDALDKDLIQSKYFSRPINAKMNYPLIYSMLGYSILKNLLERQSIDWPKQDLKTLFIVAGAAGSGKSTIIRSAYQFNIHLFGKEFHNQFLQTSKCPDHQEYDDYKDALSHGSIFQARHLHELAQDPSPPDTLLLHVDIHHVVQRLGYSLMDDNTKRMIEKQTKIPTSIDSQCEPDICDLMISSFLSHEFFRRFSKILVNTIDSTFQKCNKQFRSRSKLQGKRSKLYGGNKSKGRKAHQAMYTSWNRNIHILKPEKILFTKADNSGSLFANNQCISEQWLKQIGTSLK